MSMQFSVKSTLIPAITITAVGLLLLLDLYSVKQEALTLQKPKPRQESGPSKHGFRGDLIGYGMESNAIHSVRPDNRVALLTLANAENLLYRDSYFSGDTPEYVKAFDSISRDPAALLAFRELVIQATPSGRIYGLCGLYFSHSGLFPLAQAQLLQAPPLPILYWSSYDVVRESSTHDLPRRPEEACRTLDLFTDGGER